MIYQTTPTHPSLRNQIPPISSFVNQNGFIAKMQSVASPIFAGFSIVYFFTVGTYELFKNKVISDLKLNPNVNDQGAVLRSPSQESYKLHGSFFMGTGLCIGLESLANASYNLLNMNAIISSVKMAGGFFFIIANLIDLKENIRLYENFSSDQGSSPTSPSRHALLCGIINNLGYIAATTLVLFEVSTALALLFGIIAASTGFIRILLEIV